jgi:hypothetical protein
MVIGNGLELDDEHFNAFSTKEGDWLKVMTRREGVQAGRLAMYQLAKVVLGSVIFLGKGKVMSGLVGSTFVILSVMGVSEASSWRAEGSSGSEEMKPRSLTLSVASNDSRKHHLCLGTFLLQCRQPTSEDLH